MKTVFLLLSLMMAMSNPGFATAPRRAGEGGGMSQDNVTAAKQKMTNQSDQAADQNAQPKTDAAQEQTKSDDGTKQ